MRIKIIFIFNILLFTAVGCSSKYDIYKTYAFSRKITAGNIPVDHNNYPTTSGVQKAHLVYLETKADVIKPIWDTAWVEGVAYLIDPIKIVQPKVSIGKTKEENTTVEITPADGNILWQLLLKPLTLSETNNEVTGHGSDYPVVLSGLWNNKPVKFVIKEETELATIFSE